MKSISSEKIGVVGSGLGGLAAACTLAARGHQVVLFEKNPWLGGKAAVLEKDGFRFDMGPTILTLPKVLNRVFQEANRPLRDYLDLVRLEPQWRCFFQDGSSLDLSGDASRMKNNLQSFSPDSVDGYEKFIGLSGKLHDITNRYFFWRSIGGLGDMFDARATFESGTLKDVLTMRMGCSVGGTVRKHIPDERVAQMVDHFTQYVGSAPDASPAVLCGIAHMQTEEGIWYPMGGTGAVPAALGKLARELGVDIRLETGVRQILHQRNKVVGIETDQGERIALQAVVSNSDAVRTHSELIEGTPSDKFLKRRRYEAACSGVVLYLGLKKSYPHLAHHNFVFSRNPEEEFDAIYRQGEPAPDPTCYLCAPAQTDPAVAPQSGEALYVLVHTPYLRPHHDWKTMLPEYRDRIIEKLKTTGNMPDIEDRIVFEEALTPQGIHDRYRVLNGAIYGLASHGRFLGAFKPGNRSKDLGGLYLAGGAAHPGPGMPMVLMSGWIAADTLDSDLKKPGSGESSSSLDPARSNDTVAA